MRHTKPGSAPDYLVPLIATAHRMEALFEHGAGAPYPQVFTSLEWEAFLALLYSRAKDQEKAMPKQQQQNSSQPGVSAGLAAELGARMRRK